MTHFVLISEKNRARYLRIIQPVGDVFARIGVHPSILTVVGLILSFLAGLVYSCGAFFWAAWILLLAGACDSLDGHVARLTGKSTAFGAFLDSTLDRFGDAFPLMGLAYHFAGGLPWAGRVAGQTSQAWVVVIVILAIAGSFMVSYTRARAEGIGVECRNGVMQRPERIALLILASLLAAIPLIGPLLMKFTVIVLAIFTNLTVLQRVFHVRNRLQGKGEQT